MSTTASQSSFGEDVGPDQAIKVNNIFALKVCIILCMMGVVNVCVSLLFERVLIEMIVSIRPLLITVAVLSYLLVLFFGYQSANLRSSSKWAILFSLTISYCFQALLFVKEQVPSVSFRESFGSKLNIFWVSGMFFFLFILQALYSMQNRLPFTGAVPLLMFILNSLIVIAYIGFLIHEGAIRQMFAVIVLFIMGSSHFFTLRLIIEGKTCIKFSIDDFVFAVVYPHIALMNLILRFVNRFKATLKDEVL